MEHLTDVAMPAVLDTNISAYWRYEECTIRVENNQIVAIYYCRPTTRKMLHVI